MKPMATKNEDLNQRPFVERLIDSLTIFFVGVLCVLGMASLVDIIMGVTL